MPNLYQRLNTILKHPIKAFSLIELSIVLSIMGIMLSYAVPAYLGMQKTARLKETDRKMESLMYALAAYAQNYGTLPCAARPMIEGTNASYSPGASIPGLLNGIVPYQTLNLQKSDAQDGFGQWMTYAVAKTATIKPTMPSAPARRPNIDLQNNLNPNDATPNLPAQSSSYTMAMLSGMTTSPPIQGGSLPFHRAVSPKMSFCLLAQHHAGGNFSITQSYKILKIDIPGHSTISEQGLDNDFLAFVLISHGSSGHGAINDRGGRNPIIGQSPLKIQNASDDTHCYVDAPQSPLFDDRVRWITRNNLMAIYAKAPCAFHDEGISSMGSGHLNRK